MKLCKSIKSIFFGGRTLVLRTLLLVIAIVAIQSPIMALGAGADGPIDPEPIDPQPPPFHAPADGFSWSVPRRFGNNYVSDGMINYHWDSVSMTYDANHIFPENWPANFYGCQTPEDGLSPTATPNTYTWEWGDGTTPTNGNVCRIEHAFPAQGSYTVRLTVTDSAGLVVPAGLPEPYYFEQTVTIKDYFIVSIGDSVASGEGNPDVNMWATPNTPFPGWTERSPARWQDKRCHRSAKTGAAMAALALEGADPHTSVTFISFACSGATINTPMFQSSDPAKHLGIGILGPYWGVESDVPFSAAYEGYIPAQMDQLRAALANRPAGRPERQIDALVISAGGNDIHFGDIATKCLMDDNCWSDSRIKEDPHTNTEYPLLEVVARALKQNYVNGVPDNSPTNIPDGFDILAGEINALSPAAPANVYLTQYMDQTRNDSGGFCKMLDDVFTPLTYKISPSEAQVASLQVTAGLNAVLLTAARKYENYNWQFVDGISSYEVDPLVTPGTPGQFILGPDGKGHGYCASDNWIRRADESEIIQGPVNLRYQTRGILHPTYRGHEVFKERLLRYMLPALIPQLPQNPPQFTFSFSSGDLTDVPGQNGWFIGSQDSQNMMHSEVVAQAVVTSTVQLKGASISVNGVNGCAVTGVTCAITPSADQKQVTMSVDITLSGTYQLRFTAQDAGDQVNFLEQEIKVDLEDPILNQPIGPFAVEEGGSAVVSATVNTSDGGLLDFAWDLDNDGIFETSDEQPSISAAGVDGPTAKTIQVQVTDRAGRTATGQATVNVSNVAPAATINGAPATSPEGTAISLSSTVTDPGTADTFTYAWVVKKNGSNYTSGAQANFSFTPDDNGSYEVSLSVTDDDGGVGTASQTITATDVAPVMSNVKVSPDTANEGASVTLSGDIADAGSADTFELIINWGDGSTLETVSLAAGSTGFNRSHTYADDNPTGTASDTYSIALSLADDDGGKGTGSASVVVNNLAPTLSISAPAYGTLYALNTTVSLSAAVTDASSLDTLTCSINWDDGATSTGTVTAGVCTASHVYTAAGVYTIQMTGKDDDTGVKTASVMVVVYDPSAGFVTGGGWIDSPAGAYTADPTLAGQAHFGFVARYQKGATTPVGQTAFRFQAGDFSFQSNAYDWLVVAGARAQFKGTGSVNGVSGYSFLLTLTDGQINGGGGVDKFRIKIWDASGVVYDNMISYPEDMDGANPQAIGGGNIVIHSK